MLFGCSNDLCSRHHDAKVHDFKVVALKNNRDNVLANVVHVALHRGENHFALGLGLTAGCLLFLYVRHQVGHGCLHNASRLNHLGKKHLALRKEVAHNIHAGHEWTLNNLNGSTRPALDKLSRLLGVLNDKLSQAMHQSMLKPFLDIKTTPGQLFFFFTLARFQLSGKLNHAFGGIGAPVENNVLDMLAKHRIKVFVNTKLAGIDNAHGHTRLDRVVEEDGMNGLARGVIATE